MTHLKHPEGLGHIPLVILAAGEGSRLNNGRDFMPKPMTALEGRTLLERALLTGKEAGIKKNFVVTGFVKERVGEHAQGLGTTHGLDVKVVENIHWKEGNGTSVAACAPMIHGPFFVMMCDHLMDAGMFSSLFFMEDPDFCLLAVDMKTDRIFDPEDATRVRMEENLIVEIGKNLETYNGIDTGLFLFRPAIFEALESARQAGDASLSGGVRRLCQGKKMKAVDIGDHFWLDVDTPESLEQGKKILTGEN